MIIDLKQNYFHRVVGDMQIYGIWIDKADDSGGYEPALAITAANRDSKPFVLALSASYKYDDPRYSARAARKIADHMGFEPSITRWLKIADLIDDHLSQLISMPPAPVTKVLAAEGVMQDGDKKTSFGLHDSVMETQA